jgi:hypothetical protein
MGFIQIVVMICQIAQPDRCEEQHLQFAWEGSPQQCAASAQPYIAHWIGEHPQWTVKRYHCEYPATRRKVDAGGQARPA